MKNTYLKEILKQKGLKATPQRLLILKIILDNGHIDIDHIYKKIIKILPSISIATIYKNLKTLIDSGIVQEINLKSFKTLYELKNKEHIHLFCKNCNNLIDIETDMEILKKYFKNFINNEQIDNIDVIIYANCEKCKKDIK